jgi:anti-anti-sigma factor
MSLHIKIEQAADVAVLHCVGRLVRGEPLHFLRQAVISLKQPRIVVLDLSGMETVDGGGLGMLVFLHRRTRENAIQLKLVNPSRFVRYVLECTRLTRVLNISSVDDAVEILCSSESTTDESTTENRSWAVAIVDPSSALRHYSLDKRLQLNTVVSCGIVLRLSRKKSMLGVL